MMALRLAALISVLVTMALNGHFGWSLAGALPYAVLLATLSVALDLAKCSLLWAASMAWRQRAFHIACLFFLMFWPCLGYSLYAGVAQIAITRDGSKAAKLATAEGRANTEAKYRRLSADIDLAQASATYAATAACTNATKATSKKFCANLAALKSQLEETTRALAATPPVDAEPHLTLIAEVTHWSLPTLRFTVAIWPILLAEMCGSFVFYLTSRIAPKAPEKFTDGRKPNWLRWLPARKQPLQTRAAGSAAQASASTPGKTTVAPAPTLTWTLPRPPAR